MKRIALVILIVLVALFGLSAAQTNNLALAAVTAAPDDNTYLRLSAVQVVGTLDSLQAQGSDALSLAAADLNADGAPDLVAGYAGASGGWLAIYPADPAPAAALPFLPQSWTQVLSHAPTWLGSGDFNADGFADLVAAGQNVAQLTYLLGDGAGGLAEPQVVSLPGGVTALTVGELDRQDGLAEVVVGLDDGQVLVFAGSPDGPGVLRRSMKMPVPAAALAIGQLDQQSPYDLAVIGGSQLRILHGQDQQQGAVLPPAQVDTISLGFNAIALALGDFQAGDGQALEIAVLSSAGSLHLFNRGGQALPDSPLNEVNFPGSGGWHPTLLRAKSSTLPGDDLLLLDPAGQSLQFFNADRPGMPADAAPLASLNVGGVPRAALSLPLNGDALSDLVFLTDSASGPQYVLADPLRVFVVNITWDFDDDDIGNGKCNAASFLDGEMCSLRAAIQEANASPGLDEIRLGFKYSPNDPLPQITEALILRGTSVNAEINGKNVGSAYGLHFTSGASTVRDLRVREFQWPAIYLMTGGGHLITGVQVGGGNLGRGILISTHSNQLLDNVIADNHGDGVAIVNGNANVLRNNLIGLFSNGSGAGNQDSGVYLWNADNTVIGGSSTDRNVISSNWDGGIHITGESSGTLVQSNYIGAKEDGIQISGNNGLGGVDIENASAATIGGATTAYRNVIGANLYGVTVRGNASSSNLIRNNAIGVNAPGTGALANSSHAVRVSTSGSGNAVQILDNIIGGDSSSGHGILLSGQAVPVECIAHVVSGNIIGTNAAMSANLGLGMDGIHIEGVRCAGLTNNTVLYSRDAGMDISGAAEVNATFTGNILDGNTSDGMEINTDFNTFADNTASGNLRNGIQVFGDSNTLARNTVFFNTGAGVVIHGSDNLIQGPGDNSARIWGNSFEGLILAGDRNTVLYTHIDSNITGISIRGDNNVVGGDASGNVINGNAYGVEFLPGATGNQLIGNYLGVEADGITGAGNALANILVQESDNLIGGSSASSGNLISDAPVGILLQNWATGTTIRNNKIGTNAAGTGGLRNTIGIKIENSSNNTITDNQIAYNGDGVVVEGGIGNNITRNRIYNSTRMGIDLLPLGVTTNDDGDSDLGANHLQNYPVLTVAGILGGEGHVRGSFEGTPGADYTYNFYSVPFCDASGYGEGQTYLGQFIRTTTANGVYTFDFRIDALVLNEYVTATATDVDGNTSEFSRCVKVAVVGGADTFTVNSTADTVDADLADGICDSDSSQAGEQCTLRAAIQQANANAGANIILLPGGEYIRTRAGTSENAAVNGDLDITGDLTINGAGANVTIVDAAGLDRVFEIRNSAVVALNSLTVEGGNPGNSAGGGIFVNAGATLNLDAVTVQDNQVGASAGGGGIFNLGAMSASNSSVVNNQAGLNGGGLYQFGGGSAWKNSTFSGNQSAAHGGGIAAETTTVQLSNVTVAYNTADSDGNGGDGGGLYQTGSTFSLQNSVIAENEDLSPGSYPHGLADCAGAYTSTGYNLVGDQAKPSAAPAGCTLTGGTGDSLGGTWLHANYLTFYAGLGPLQLNGGTTPNHSPFSSAAGLVVDWGSPSEPGTGGGACELIDQRGQPRPLDGGTDGVARCDRGAVEHIPITVSVGDASVAEGGIAEFAVSLSASAQVEFTVDFAVTGITALAGTDFQAVQGTLTFPVGTTLQTVQVTTLTDTYNETDETFQVQLSIPRYVFIADGSGIGTILDSSPQPSILINDVSVTEGAPGASVSASFNVTLNSPSGKQVSVAYSVSGGSATAGEDFVQGQGVLTFSPGTASQNLAVTILGDNLQEGVEDYAVILSNPVNATVGDSTGAGSIVDDDIPSLSISDSAIFEADSSVTMYFVVQLSLPSIGAISVNYITSPGSAQPGGDYTHTSGTLTFAAGETAKTIQVTILGDQLIEATETFTVTINTPSGGAVLGDASATGIIEDDEAVSQRHLYLPFVRR